MLILRWDAELSFWPQLVCAMYANANSHSEEAIQTPFSFKANQIRHYPDYIVLHE
jgi:hypothetical protein